MDRTPVSSSHIASIGYDPNSMTLEVEFTDGGLYQYFDVPESVFQELMQADSKGRYMHANVRNCFRYAKL